MALANVCERAGWPIVNISTESGERSQAVCVEVVHVVVTTQPFLGVTPS